MENYNIGGWFNRVYYSWHDGLIWPTVYTIKQNKWKSKRRREENLKIIEKVNGSVQLCPKCDGYGFPNHLFYLFYSRLKSAYRPHKKHSQ